MWPLRNDFASILGGKNAPKSKLLQEVGFFFFRKVFKTLRLSAKINVFLVRKAEIIENRHQNRHKNSVIEKCAPEGDVFPIWQPFWIVLVRFCGILGHFWVSLGVKRDPSNQTMLNKSQLLNPQMTQESF